MTEKELEVRLSLSGKHKKMFDELLQEEREKTIESIEKTLCGSERFSSMQKEIIKEFLKMLKGNKNEQN